MLKILIVEDNKSIAKEIMLKMLNYGDIQIAHTVNAAKKKINSSSYSHIFVDLTLKDKYDGFQIIEAAKEKKIKVAALTSEPSQTIINKVLKELKADIYFEKIYFFEEWSPDLLEKFFYPKSKINLNDFFKKRYISKNPRLINDIETVIETSKQKDRVTLILGPTGVGKTLLASVIHKHSSSKGKLIELNVNQVSPELLESTLFGHVKGSFTGAVKNSKGLLEQANNGTLFLDEISDISIQMQQKLLTAIESKMIRPIGSEQTISTNFKLICAGKNLFEKVKSFKILPDFYYRIHDIVLNIEALRKRPEDIEAQIFHFLKLIRKKRKTGTIGISNEVLSTLKKYSWPGNTRELYKELNNLADKSTNFIDIKHLPVKYINSTFHNNSFHLSDEQISFLEKNGLKKFIAEIEKKIINKYINQEQKSKLHISKFLRVNKDVINRMAKQNQTGTPYGH